MKFKVGDTVIGNKEANEKYIVTREGWTGIVTEVYKNYFNADIFSLDYKCFDLLRNGVHMCELNNAKFGVKYDRDVDPVEFFKTKKEAQKRIEELLDDSEVDKKSIFLFEVGDVWELSRPVTYDLKKVQ